MHLLNQIGVLALDDEEFDTLMEVFAKMDDKIMLCSSYMAIKYGTTRIAVTDDMIAELIKIAEKVSKEHRWFSVIDKILKFRSEVQITI